MILYKNFELSDRQTVHVKRRNMQLAAYKYAKTNNTDLPDGDSYYTASDDKIRKYKDAFYALQYDEGVDTLDSNGHEFVGLGLPSGTLWAKCNVGASSENEYGGLYQWGGLIDMSDKSASWDSYPYGNGDTKLSKYNVRAKNGVVDNIEVLSLEDDAAHMVMGGDWKMPTEEQIQELLNNTTIENGVMVNGIKGTKFINRDDSDKYIFIPFGGYRNSGRTYDKTSAGMIWSSSLHLESPYYGYRLFCNADDSYITGLGRYLGLSVRGVLNR